MNKKKIKMQNDNKKLKIIFVVVGTLFIFGVWLLTLKYNLQGGFRKKIDTAKPVQASGQIDEIEEKIKTLKERFQNNKTEIDQLLQKTHE